MFNPTIINEQSCSLKIQGGSNMTGTDFFFVTIIAHHSSHSQTVLLAQSTGLVVSSAQCARIVKVVVCVLLGISPASEV